MSGEPCSGNVASRRSLPLRSIRASFTFLTRLPLGGFPYSDEEFRWAPAHFPLVGSVVGGLAALVFLAGEPLGHVVAASLSVGAAMLTTGAFHEDGLADTMDAMGGATSAPRVFEILKDSRIGSYGTVAIFMVLLLRVTALAELGDAVALIVAGCVARLGPVWLMATLPYVTGADSKSSSLSRAGKVQVAVASLWVGAVLAVLGALGLVSPLACALVVGLALGSAYLLGRWFRARVGGVTGDFLGATEQVGEVLVLLALLALTRGSG